MKRNWNSKLRMVRLHHGENLHEVCMFVMRFLSLSSHCSPPLYPPSLYCLSPLSSQDSEGRCQTSLSPSPLLLAPSHPVKCRTLSADARSQGAVIGPLDKWIVGANRQLSIYLTNCTSFTQSVHFRSISFAVSLYVISHTLIRASIHLVIFGQVHPTNKGMRVCYTRSFYSPLCSGGRSEPADKPRRKKSVLK